MAKVNVLITKKRKLRPKTVDYVFLGYAHQSIAYMFLVVKSEVLDVHVDSMMESRDATFFELIFPIKDLHSMSRLSSEIISKPTPSLEIIEQVHEQDPKEDDS